MLRQKRNDKPIPLNLPLRDVCFWHFSDIPTAPMDVRYRGKAVMTRTGRISVSERMNSESLSAQVPPR